METLMKSSGTDQRINELFSRFNEPVISKERIRRWLDRFDDEDKPAALALLGTIEFHTYPRLLRESRLLHTKLLEKLAADGFDARKFSDIDFSREFTCKSGDIISYIYRKANAIPSVDFRNFDLLISEMRDGGDRFAGRALVILDDYIGTGSQFIFQFIARSDVDIRILNNYRKVYLASIIANENALQKFTLLGNRKFDEVLTIEERQFPDYDWSAEEKDLRAALGRVDWNRIQFIFLELERSLLSPENAVIPPEDKQSIGEFLRKHGADSTLTTSFLAGHHAFFYGAVNSLPKILYPLFSRVEDYTIYPVEHFIGNSANIINWDIDDGTG